MSYAIVSSGALRFDNTQTIYESSLSSLLSYFSKICVTLHTTATNLTSFFYLAAEQAGLTGPLATLSCERLNNVLNKQYSCVYIQ